jgi:hypothetical protein
LWTRDRGGCQSLTTAHADNMDKVGAGTGRARHQIKLGMHYMVNNVHTADAALALQLDHRLAGRGAAQSGLADMLKAVVQGADSVFPPTDYD